VILRFVPGMIGAAKKDSKLSVVSPLHAPPSGLRPAVTAQLARGQSPRCIPQNVAFRVARKSCRFPHLPAFGARV
jgi:hypothetical protein